MDANRNDPKYADAILKLADQGVWPEGERNTAPCTLSCCNFLSRGFPVQMINLLQHICMVSTSAIKHHRRFLFVSSRARLPTKYLGVIPSVTHDSFLFVQTINNDHASSTY